MNIKKGKSRKVKIEKIEHQEKVKIYEKWKSRSENQEEWTPRKVKINKSKHQEKWKSRKMSIQKSEPQEVKMKKNDNQERVTRKSEN